MEMHSDAAQPSQLFIVAFKMQKKKRKQNIKRKRKKIRITAINQVNNC